MCVAEVPARSPQVRRAQALCGGDRLGLAEGPRARELRAQEHGG